MKKPIEVTELGEVVVILQEYITDIQDDTGSKFGCGCIISTVAVDNNLNGGNVIHADEDIHEVVDMLDIEGIELTLLNLSTVFIASGHIIDYDVDDHGTTHVHLPFVPSIDYSCEVKETPAEINELLNP